MSDPRHESPAVEVRCHTCDVSFPVGTKQCVHCGGRIGRPLFGLQLPDAEGDGETPIFEAEEVEETELETAQRRLLRIGFTVFWLGLALISTLARSCGAE